MTLINIVEIFTGIMLVVLAFMAINSKTLIKAVILLSSLSMLSVIAFVILRAPDVAVTEAVIGSGITTSLFVFTLLSVRKVGKKHEELS